MVRYIALFVSAGVHAGAQLVQSLLMFRAADGGHACREKYLQIIKKRQIPAKDAAERVKIARLETFMKASDGGYADIERLFYPIVRLFAFKHCNDCEPFRKHYPFGWREN